MTTNEIPHLVDVITKINDELWEQNRMLADEGVQYLELSINGYDAVITFLGIDVWNSVDDPRAISEETGDWVSIQDHLVAKVHELLSQLSKLSLDDK